jgi:hypothetical protein
MNPPMRYLVALTLLASCASSPAAPEAKTQTSSSAAPLAQTAEVGKPAPDFTLAERRTAFTISAEKRWSSSGSTRDARS